MMLSEFLDELELVAGRQEETHDVGARMRWRAACELFARETFPAFQECALPVVVVLIHPSGNAWLRRTTGWVRDGCGELAEIGSDAVEALRRYDADPHASIRQLCRDRGGHAFYGNLRSALVLARIEWRRRGRSGVEINARFLFVDLGKCRARHAPA